MRISMPRALATGLACTALLVAGCGSSDEGGDAADPAATSTAAAAASAVEEAAASAEDAATSAVAAAAGAGAKVSANDASVEELAAAFTAAGIPSAERWAREVAEYRPYDAADTGWTHLRDELAKYDPDPAVVEQIIATLEP